MRVKIFTVSRLVLYTFCLLIFTNSKAQLYSNSPIWGNSIGSQNIIGEPLSNDPYWGILPSSQTLSRDTSQIRIRRNINGQRRIYRDALGNPVIADPQGNIIYDMYGNPIIDSSALNQTASNVDIVNSGPAIPPDDPVDVPIDGSVGILLMLGIGIGYKNHQQSKSKLAKFLKDV